jgi:glycerol-3-phosphate dehydrogenase
MSEFYDIGIIGGGIQGCGLAQAAAALGYRTVVIEREALAAGTSSKSSKLIHGGLRYLESGQIALVRHSLQERELLIRNAPRLVHYVPFYIPIYKQTSRRRWQLFTGLSLYAALGNFRPYACFRRVPVADWSKLDGLQTRELQAVYQYWDAQTDDAQLTRAVMQSARKLGAQLICPATVERIDYQSGEYHVAYSNDKTAGIARCVILLNAAGPWVDRVHAMITPASEFPAMELVQGTHILLRQPAPDGVYYVESPSDRRAVFVMPWHGQTLVGTTEQIYRGDPALVTASEHEIEYLRNIARHYFPYVDDTLLDRFSGLRVLPSGPRSPFARPRDTVLYSVPTLPGYVALLGGKLTGYRVTAQKVMQMVKDRLRSRMPIADTRELPLVPVDAET